MSDVTGSADIAVSYLSISVVPVNAAYMSPTLTHVSIDAVSSDG